MDDGRTMNEQYTFNFVPNEKVLGAALRMKPPAVKVRGQKASMALRLLHCTLLALGGAGFGYIGSQLLTGTATFLHWTSAVGIALSYLAIFGSVFITVPTLIRQSLAARASQSPVKMIVDASGVQTATDMFQSKIGWQGVDGLSRSKLSFVLWFGGNRPSIPFTAFEGSDQMDAFEIDVNSWIEGSR
jgi:hypothetical protein